MPLNTETMKKTLQKAFITLRRFMRWIIISLTTGLLVGLAGGLFAYTLNWVTAMRGAHGWLLYFLPVAGLIVTLLYHVAGRDSAQGTNLVISSIRTEQQPPAVMAPLIFVSTALTHLCGGSAGREGAALQLGGSMGNLVGRAFRLDDRNRRVVIMCGMSAAFSALFGTPIAATVFAMELTSVGVMYYSALVPCALSSLLAARVAGWMRIKPELFHIAAAPEGIEIVVVWRVLVLSALCAVAGILMCYVLHHSGRLYERMIPNLYLRAAAGGALVIGLTLVLGTRDYLGAGMDVIERAIDGRVNPAAFALKLLFTAVTLGAGFKGGEIVPAFFIGATFGGLAGGLVGLPVSFSAAVGLVTLFSAVTNCPITALLLAFELFGFVSPAYFLLAASAGYALSGYFSLYSAQKILYDKMEAKYIDRPTL